jgi:hypothetical protein
VGARKRGRRWVGGDRNKDRELEREMKREKDLYVFVQAEGA